MFDLSFDQQSPLDVMPCTYLKFWNKLMLAFTQGLFSCVVIPISLDLTISNYLLVWVLHSHSFPTSCTNAQQHYCFCTIERGGSGQSPGPPPFQGSVPLIEPQGLSRPFSWPYLCSLFGCQVKFWRRPQESSGQRLTHGLFVRFQSILLGSRRQRFMPPLDEVGPG